MDNVKPDVTLRVCRGTSCSSYFGNLLCRDIEELCGGFAVVEPRKCMGRCGSGPNVEVLRESAECASYVSSIRSFEIVEQLVKQHVSGPQIDKMQKQIAKLKYKARREREPQKRLQTIEQAVALLGEGASDSHPRLLRELLVLRARETVKQRPSEALDDVLRAAEMSSDWAQAHLALADVLEGADRKTEAAEALRSALRIGTGLGSDRGVLARRLARLKGEDFTDEPEFVPWRIEQVVQLNSSCIQLSLRSSNMAMTATHVTPQDAWHVDILAELGSPASEVVRSYTPASNAEMYQKGKIDLAVKVYPNGVMTKHMASLKKGHQVLVSTPQPTLDTSEYTGVAMIAGGSSVTVALQVCRSVLARHPKRGQVRLVLCNHTAQDIMLKKEVDALVADYSGFKVIHCISEGSLPNARGSSAIWKQGRVSATVLSTLEAHLRAIVSGPSGFCVAVRDILVELGRHQDDMVVLDELPPPNDAEDVMANLSSAALSSGTSSTPVAAGKTSEADIVVDDVSTPKSGHGEIVVDDLHVPDSNTKNQGALVGPLAKNDVSNAEILAGDFNSSGIECEKIADFDLADLEEPEPCRCCQWMSARAR